MKEHPFNAFLELVDFDKGVYLLNQSITQLEKEISQTTSEKGEHIARLDHAKQWLHDMQKDVDAKELEMKVFSEQEEENKKRLNTVTSEKEYQAIKKEITTLKKQQHDYEQILVDAWGQLESAQREYDTLNASLESTLADFETKLQEKTKELESLQADKAGRKKKRSEKLTSVPEEWLEKYEVMSEQVADPVVPLINDSCSSCFYQVPSQDMISLKHGKLLQCKGCYRFLYIEKQEEQETVEA